MGNYKGRILAVLTNRPWYSWIEHDVLGIAERIRKIDKGYFILYNHKMKRFEVHHVDNFPNTYGFSVQYDELDSRTLEQCIRSRREHTDRLLAEMEENNRKIKESNKKDFDNALEAASLQTADELAYAIEEDELHKGYRRTFGGIAIEQ